MMGKLVSEPELILEVGAAESRVQGMCMLTVERCWSRWFLTLLAVEREVVNAEYATLPPPPPSRKETRSWPCSSHSGSLDFLAT